MKPKRGDFWSRVERSSGCWLWQGSIHHSGYGEVRRNYKIFSAHRTAYELAKGKIALGLHVLHSCDNRACCNPDHLFLGTNADNVADRNSKQRQARGEKNHAKLTETDVRCIRWLATSGFPHREIGAEFGVGHVTIGGIIRRQKWKHIC